MRLVAYLGLLLLFAVALFVAWMAFAGRDWYGLVVMAGFMVLLTLFWHMLRQSARQNPEVQSEWMHVHFGAFIRGPLMRTLEGWIYLAGSLCSLMFAGIAWLDSSFLGLDPNRSAVHTILFGVWPIVSFVLYVKFNAPRFHTGALSVCLTLVAVGFPYYMVFKPVLLG